MSTVNLKKIVAEFGTQQQFAEMLSAKVGREVSQQSVSQWIRRGQVPAWACGVFEGVTDGEVTAHELRPDVFPETF